MFKNQNVVLGGGILLALLSIGFGWYFLLRPKNSKTNRLTNAEKKNLVDRAMEPKNVDAEEGDDVEEEAEEVVVETIDKKVDSAVLEEEDSDEEDQEEALKQAYDDALRLAKKFLAGNQHTKAANKFSDAIDLADKIPSAAKDIVTLYNNRSAMYEKCNELDKSLNDIMVVLTMDPHHLKARIRRGRIYEAQGLLRQSAIDFAIATLLERVKNLPPSNPEKIDEFVKKLAIEQLQQTMEDIKCSKKRDLPCKSHCRNFMDSFPSYHLWKTRYAHTDRDELVEAVMSAGGPFMENEQWCDMTNLEHMTLESIPARFETIYTLACFDLSKGLFKKGFDEIARCCAVLRSAEISADNLSKSYHEMYEQLLKENPSFRWIAASIEDLYGTSLHLSADLQGAKEAYQNSLRIEPLPAGFEAALKLASIYVEIGTNTESTQVYDEIANSFSDDSNKLEQAWLNIHRVSHWISRKENGNFESHALEKAIECVDVAIALTEGLDLEHDTSARNCRLLAFIKQVHVLLQTKSQMGKQPDNDDIAAAKKAVAEAKKISPKHETVMMLEVDFLTTEGNYDEALQHIEEIIALSDGDDAIPHVFKANTLAQKAMLHFQIAQQYNSQADAMEAQSLLKQVDEIYEKAINLDPNGLEALLQSAQLKTMFGDLQGAMELAARALPLARSRDEALEVLNIKIMTEIQLAAIGEIQKSNNVPN